MAYEGGPYLQVGCFCETVIEDKAGVLSLIRIIDTVNHMQAGPNPPEEMPTFVYGMYLVLMFKSGQARGRSNLKIVPEKPDGATQNAIAMTAHWEGEEKGQNFITQIAYQFDLEGLYWFKVYLNDHLLTAIPLRVKYDRIVRPAGG